LLDSNGIAELNVKRNINILKTKYPLKENESQNNDKDLPTNHIINDLFTDDSDVSNYFLNRNKGSAEWLSGLNYKDLIKYKPDTIPLLRFLLNLIASGDLGSQVRETILAGRGIALNKDNLGSGISTIIEQCHIVLLLPKHTSTQIM
jgi:hypothetical protein